MGFGSPNDTVWNRGNSSNGSSPFSIVIFAADDDDDGTIQFGNFIQIQYFLSSVLPVQYFIVWLEPIPRIRNV